MLRQIKDDIIKKIEILEKNLSKIEFQTIIFLFSKEIKKILSYFEENINYLTYEELNELYFFLINVYNFFINATSVYAELENVNNKIKILFKKIEDRIVDLILIQIKK